MSLTDARARPYRSAVAELAGAMRRWLLDHPEAERPRFELPADELVLAAPVAFVEDVAQNASARALLAIAVAHDATALVLGEALCTVPAHVHLVRVEPYRGPVTITIGASGAPPPDPRVLEPMVVRVTGTAWPKAPRT